MDNTTQPQIAITIQDLDTIKNIIDLATARGAFRAAEMAEIGAVYNKLSQFLSSVIEQAKAQAETSTDTTNPQGE
jgi:hypothetical protein